MATPFQHTASPIAAAAAADALADAPDDAGNGSAHCQRTPANEASHAATLSRQHQSAELVSVAAASRELPGRVDTGEQDTIAQAFGSASMCAGPAADGSLQLSGNSAPADRPVTTHAAGSPLQQDRLDVGDGIAAPYTGECLAGQHLCEAQPKVHAGAAEAQETARDLQTNGPASMPVGVHGTHAECDNLTGSDQTHAARQDGTSDNHTATCPFGARFDELTGASPGVPRCVAYYRA